MRRGVVGRRRRRVVGAIAAVSIVAVSVGATLASGQDGGVTVQAAPLSAAAQLTVDGKSNIYGAGRSTAPAPSGGGGGLLPPFVPVQAGSVVQFTSVTGTVGCCGNDPRHPADGGQGATVINAYDGISGIRFDAQLFLAGVFLTAAAPSGAAPPTFTGRLDFTQLTPQVGQVFFVGDGRTGRGSGVLQRFVVPAGATRLYLGFADAFSFRGDPGWYQDNHGTLSVTLQVGAAPGGPPTGTATGTVTVNGQPFTSGPIPYGSTVDVTSGRLTLRADVGTLIVYGDGSHPAILVPRRTSERVKAKKRSLVQLTLVGDFSVCSPARRAATHEQQKPKHTVVRALWGKGKGRFRTRGRYASATVRGTFWLTADRCDGTFVSVRQGVLQVNDLTRRKKVSVRAGGSYLAPAR